MEVGRGLLTHHNVVTHTMTHTHKWAIHKEKRDIKMSIFKWLLKLVWMSFIFYGGITIAFLFFLLHCFLFYFFFLFNLLGCYWLTKLFKFQVHNSITHYLYTVLYIRQPKSSLCPSPFILLYPPPPLCTLPPRSNHHTVVWVHNCYFFHFCSISLSPK